MYRITALQNRSQREISNRMDGRFAIPHTDLDDEMDVGEEAGLDG